MSATTTRPAPARTELDEFGSIRLLSIQDRCDRCGAQAWVRATLDASGKQLLFCIHHSRVVEPVLRPQTAHWLDESRFLNERPSPSAGS